MVHVIVYILILFMLLAALIALEAKNLLSSVVSIGAVGFMLSVVFLMLRAPDIAIIQVIIEILTLVILIRATIAVDVHLVKNIRQFFPFAICMVLLLLLFMFASKAMDLMPEFGNYLSKVSPHYLANGLKETGSANIVTSVILDYRAYDTLGEATVLFTAILGAVVLLRRKAKND